MNISAEEKNRYLREAEVVLAREGFLRIGHALAACVSCLMVRRCARYLRAAALPTEWHKNKWITPAMALFTDLTRAHFAALGQSEHTPR